MKKKYRLKEKEILLAVLMLTVLFTQSLIYSQATDKEIDMTDPLLLQSVDQQVLDSIFRIDIQSIEVVFDYYPDNSSADGRALVYFKMRPGQVRPVIHFDPAIQNNVIQSLKLDNEVLNFSSQSDVKILSYNASTQQAIEFQRDLTPNVIHVLEIEYTLTFSGLYPRFSSEVNDYEGRGNEIFFPTINVPHELARHKITFRVHGERNFRFIGSGLVTKDISDVQQWTLDTERDIASYCVLFVLMPEEDTVYEEKNIAGVDVRILAFLGGGSIDSAFSVLETWLPELITNLGPFPMPRGLSIFLVSYGGGMEYYGGTITSLWALEHEIFHMYFACSTVNSTYRDSWLDEAIDSWYEDSKNPSFSPINQDYSSNIVSGREAVAVGFDLRAYNEGARIIEAAAQEIGGRDAMVSFLSYLYKNYVFQPFTTLDFLRYLEDFSGVNMVDKFTQWLYSGNSTSLLGTAVQSSYSYDKYSKEVDLTPPPLVLKKYKINTKEIQ